jgi:hypothetical protein
MPEDRTNGKDKGSWKHTKEVEKVEVENRFRERDGHKTFVADPHGCSRHLICMMDRAWSSAAFEVHEVHEVVAEVE